MLCLIVWKNNCIFLDINKSPFSNCSSLSPPSLSLSLSLSLFLSLSISLSFFLLNAAVNLGKNTKQCNILFKICLFKITAPPSVYLTLRILLSVREEEMLIINRIKKYIFQNHQTMQKVQQKAFHAKKKITEMIIYRKYINAHI